MGRIPKPNHLRKQEGNREHRKIVPEARHKHGSPERPQLAANAKRIWDRLIEDMDPLVIRRTDREALATLCRDEARLIMANEAFDELCEKNGGFTGALATPEGKHLWRAIRDQTTSLVAQRREFGLTPSSRSRVAGGNEPAGTIDDAV